MSDQFLVFLSILAYVLFILGIANWIDGRERKKAMAIRGKTYFGDLTPAQKFHGERIAARRGQNWRNDF